MNNLPALARMIENLIRFGTIAETQMKPPRVRVKTGDLLTGWLPWIALRAGADTDWERQCTNGGAKLNRETGAAIGTLEHIGQSISDILTTRLGTRVMRREYGSLLPELVDQPFNDATRLRVYAASVMAIMRWEPRVSLTRIQLQGATLQGQVVMDIEGRVLDRNQALSMSLPLQLGGGA